MKEPTVHGGAVKDSKIAAIGIGENGFGAELAADGLKARGDGIESSIPRDALEGGFGGCAFRCDAAQRIEDAIGGVNTVKVFGNFCAEKAARDGVRRIALNLRSPSIVNGDEDTAGVGTIVGTGGVDHCGHEGKL